MQLGHLPIGLAAFERAIELNGRAVEMNKRALSWGRLAAHDPAALSRAVAGDRGDEREAAPASLAEMVATRAAFLTSYQNSAYANRYRKLVEEVTARENEVGGNAGRLAMAVARYYFKLLAYKDEFEVARLYSDGSFQRQLDAEFEGDFRIQLHIAPQLFFPRDPDTGRAKKIQLLGWALPFFLLISKFKFLRGTPFDIFAMTAHRKLERRLITDYEATVALLLDGLSPDNLSVAVDIASVPEHIRGFDLVKEEQLESAKAKEAELLEAFRQLTP